MPADAATGVGRDSVRSFEGDETADVAQTTQSQQAQVAPHSSAAKSILFYIGIFIAFIAALGVIGLGFGMWKSSKDGNSNPSPDVTSSSQPANLTRTYVQTFANFLPYPEFDTV
jgi:hypothetical protein